MPTTRDRAYDGYRMLARVVNGSVHDFTRNGNDWTAKMQSLAEAIAALPVGNAGLDGDLRRFLQIEQFTVCLKAGHAPSCGGQTEEPT